MSLPTPILDDRTFQDIVDECKRMIPHYAPEWTDHNVSDPGVTLIELFAWMTELLLYRVNQVPRRNYIKFLELMGVSLDPAHPARTEVRFRLAAPQPVPVTIPTNTEVATVRTETQEAIVFATEAALEITIPRLGYALVSRDETAYFDYTPALHNPQLRVPIFEERPRPGNAFYLGYYGDLAAHTLLLHLDCEIQGIGVNPDQPPLVYEYYDGSLQDWRPLQVEEDGTGGLNRPGDVIVHLPLTSRPRELDRRRATWLRCRIVETTGKQPRYATSPRVLDVRTQSIGGAAMAVHSQVIGTEPLGRSDGTPGQTFTLSATPVLPRRAGETLEVEGDQPGTYESWQEVRDFGPSGPLDRHYTLDSACGQVVLGPGIRLPSGEERRHGATPLMRRALRFTMYRTGGGLIGNVGARTLTELKTSIPYVARVTNPRPAIGGTEVETIDAAMVRGPGVLHDSPRAVTADDFERLALAAHPDVARARCRYAREAGDGSAGSVHLTVVPRMTTTTAVVPPEELALADKVRTAVQTYLDDRRMITVRLGLETPQYLAVSITVEAHRRPRTNQVGLKQAVEEALYRFIHPTVGGPDGLGWPFDRPLYPSDIYSVVQGVQGVEHAAGVRFRIVPEAGTTGSDGTIDADGTLQPVARKLADDKPLHYTVLCSAVHQVTVT